MRYEIRDGENGWILSNYEDAGNQDLLRGNPSEEHIFKKWEDIMKFLKNESKDAIVMTDADMAEARGEWEDSEE
jgi:hypothetical protein